MRRGLAPIVALVLLAACDEPAASDATKAAQTPAVVEAPPLEASAPPPLETAAPAALVARGAALVTQHECVRCHTIEGVAKPTLELDCVGCHRQILAGTLELPAAELAGYQARISSLVDVPELVPGNRFRRAWLEGFLADTHDLRPNLAPSMPRLALATDDVAAIAAFISPAGESAAPALGDATRGREIAGAKGCGTCHRFAGTDPLPAVPPPVTIAPDALALAQRLAPDLVHARVRLRPAGLIAWLTDPTAIEPGTQMPKIPMTEQEVLDVAAFLIETPVQPEPGEPMPERVAAPSRAVGYEEVDERIFHRTCRHCHSDPEQVIGDGGPGYSGGFGFRKRGLDLNSYEGLHSGSLDDGGRRRSLFEPMADGTPRIVAHLWARHAEIAGRPVEGIRGMPLGLPAVPPEDIALLEAWIAQGHRRAAGGGTP